MKAIFTRYRGATNHGGAIIIATDHDGNRVSIPYDYAAKDPHRLAAVALCKKLGWHGTLIEGGDAAAGNVYVWSTGDKVRV